MAVDGGGKCNSGQEDTKKKIVRIDGKKGERVDVRERGSCEVKCAHRAA